MTVTLDQAASLLAVAAAFDQRTIGRADATAWQAALTDLDFEASRDAVVEHYRSHRERVTVADIRGQVRAAQRRRAEDRHNRDVLTDARAIPGTLNDGWPVGDDPHWGRHNSLDLLQIHAETNVVPCRYCQAEAGRCINKTTGNATKIPHSKRLVDAKRAADGAS